MGDASYTIQVKTQYMCSYCARLFANLSDMQTHVLSHSRGVNDCCSCHVCGKSYNTPSKLRRHVRTHTGEKPYPCEICGRCFGRSDHLKQHMKVHFMTSKRQKNLCRLCGMMFLKTDTLLAHLTEHGVHSVHDCALCGEVFDGVEKLEQHEKGHLIRDSQGKVNPDHVSFQSPTSRLAIDITSVSDIRGLMAQHGGDPETIFAELMLGVARFSSTTSTINSSMNSSRITLHSSSEANSSTSDAMFGFSIPGAHLSTPMFPRNVACENAEVANENEVLEERMQISSTYSVGDPQTESSDSHENFPSSNGSYLAHLKRTPLITKKPDTGHVGSDNVEPQHSSQTDMGHEVHTLTDNEEKVELENVRRPRKGRPVSKNRACNLVTVQAEENDSSFGESEVSSQLVLEEEEGETDQLDSSLNQSNKHCKGTGKRQYSSPREVLVGEDSESEGDRNFSVSTPGSLADLSSLSGQLPQSSITNIYNRSLANHGLREMSSKPQTSIPLGCVEVKHMPLEVQQYRRRHPSTIPPEMTHRETVVAECQGASLPVDLGYRCHHCHIWFEDYSMCLLHNSLHANSGQTPFTCVKCGKRLGNRLEFTAHLIWHLTPNMDIS